MEQAGVYRLTLKRKQCEQWRFIPEQLTEWRRSSTQEVWRYPWGRLDRPTTPSIGSRQDGAEGVNSEER